MPLPDPCAGWPAFNANLQGWGAQLLQALAPVAITTWHDAEPQRRRFVGQPAVANNLNVAGSANADVGVALNPTGNVLGNPPNLGAQLRWIRRGGAPGVAGLNIRGEIGMDRQLAPPPTVATQVLAFELLTDPGAGQPDQVSLGVEVTVRPSKTTIELNLSASGAPGPLRVRVGLVSGTPVAAAATNTAQGASGNRQTGFLDDGGTPSVFGAPGIGGLGVELLASTSAGGAIATLSQLRVQIDLPVAGASGATAGPVISVLGGDGFDLAARLISSDPATGEIDATVTLAGLPAQLKAELATDQPDRVGLAWSTGSGQQPRSARLPMLEAAATITPASGAQVRVLARLTDLPPGLDATVDTTGSFELRGVSGSAESPIGTIRAELLSGAQAAPALSDFIWLDLPGGAAAAELRDLQRIEVAWPAGAPITAALGFAARHPLSGFITAAGIRGNATIADLPRAITVTADVANAAVAWEADEPIYTLSADVTLVTTDPATGDGTGIIRVAGELDDVPAKLEVEVAADRLALAFDPAAPSAVAATVQLAEPDGWLPGEPPPALPAFDRTVEASAEGLPAELELRADPGFAALMTGAKLRWRASGEVAVVVAQLDGFALGPLTSVRARGGQLAPVFEVEYSLDPLVIDVDVAGGDRIGVLHVLAADRPVVAAGAAPRRIDADIDLRNGFDVAVTLRGLKHAHAALPLAGGPNLIDASLRLGVPGAFPGGFTAQGPQLRGWVRTDELDLHADAGTLPDDLALTVDLDTFAVDARLPVTDLDVDVTGLVALLGEVFDIDADLRTPAVPDRVQVIPERAGAGELTKIAYTASAPIDDLLLELEATPAPLFGFQHARATLELPAAITVDLATPALDIPDGIKGMVRVRANRDVPLPTTARRGQVLRVITVDPAALPTPTTTLDPAALTLGSFGVVEAAVGKIEAFAGFTTVGRSGPAGGLSPLRGPRLLLTGAGDDQRIFASIQRRIGPNRLLRLVQAQLGIVRPAQIDLLTTPGAMGEIGVRFPGPLRPVGTATTLGSFTARLEPPYRGVPGGPPVGERDPAFVVGGVTTAGIGAVSATIAAVPAHVEVALTNLGPFGTVATPLTITNPFDGTTLGIPAGWGGMRVDLIFDGILALRSLSATLYSLDWQRSQRWQRITAGRIDVRPSGRDASGVTPSDRAITLHQFGLDPTVANGGAGGLGLALAVPSNAPINLSAVIFSSEFPRTAAAPSAPSGFSETAQVDLGNLSGFLGLRVDPIPIINKPLIPTERDATNAPPSEWRIVAATGGPPVFLGNTDLVPESVLAQIGLGIAASIVGGIVGGPWGAVAGVGLVVFEAQYFTALQPPVLGPLPSATT